MFFSTVIPLAAIFVSPVWAQLNMARCATGFDWNRNTLGQDPCTVGSVVDASCRGLTEYAYPPLTDSTEYYLPPRADRSGDLMCHCNTVMYSLSMACVSCQGGQVYSWTEWITECAKVYVSQYPANIPPGTAIPHWAYYDITLLLNQTWSDSVAAGTTRYPGESLKRAYPEPTPISSPDSPSSSSTSSVSPIPTSSPGKTTSIKVPSSPPPVPSNPSNPPAVPSDSPEPTTPTDTTNSPGSTTTSESDPSEPTTSTSRSTSSSRPTNRTSSTSPTRPTNPAGTNTNTPASTNAGNTKIVTNVWAIVAVPFLWALT